MPGPTFLAGPGQANAAGDRAALFLKLFAGETLRLLERRLIVMDSTFVKRAIAGSKTASFPTFGDASANYHVPGDDLILDTDGQSVGEAYLSAIKVGEHNIHADRVLQSSVLLDELEGILSHWDHRSAFSSKLTRAIAEQSEDALFRLIAAASGVPAATNGGVQGTLVTGWPVGTSVVTTTEPTATQVYDNLFTAAQTFDTNNVEAAGRVAATTQALFYAVLRLTGTSPAAAYEVINSRYVGVSGPNGDLAHPNTNGLFIGNIFLMPSNGIPTDAGKYTANAWSLNSSDQNPYGDPLMTKLVRLLVWQGETIGTVKARAPRLDVNWIPERLSHLITLSQAVGHGVLRPEGAYTVRVTV